MPPGCGVVASAMLFLVFNGVTIIIILCELTGDIDCMQMSYKNYLKNNKKDFVCEKLPR